MKLEQNKITQNFGKRIKKSKPLSNLEQRNGKERRKSQKPEEQIHLQSLALMEKNKTLFLTSENTQKKLLVLRFTHLVCSTSREI